MAQQGVGNTALGAAVCRLIEQYQPREIRLFDDSLVKDLVGAPLSGMLQFAGMRKFTVNRTEAVGKGIYGGQVCRTRFIDDATQSALSGGIGQLVILGAGLDTRPYRLPGIEKVQVFEVDLPSVQNEKKRSFKKVLGGCPITSHFYPLISKCKRWKPFSAEPGSTLPARRYFSGKP